MKHTSPYPLIFIAAIILDRVVISSTQIGIAESLRTLFILSLLATLAMAVIQYFIKDSHRTSFIVGMVPAAFIAYRSCYSYFKIHFPYQADYLGFALMVLLGGLYAAIVRRSVWRRIQKPAQITAYLNVVFITLLSFQVIRLGQDGYRMVTSLNSSQNRAIPAFDLDLHLEKELTPDIYVIVLDSYGREDVLRDMYGYDNSEFIGWAKERGFYVADESHSNYIQTPYSMASLWNFNHIQAWDSSYEYAKYLSEPIQNNYVFRALKEIGYTTVSFEGALHYTEIRSSDVYLSSFLPLNDFETLLLVDSPLEPLSNLVDLKIPVQTYKTHRQRTLYQLETLKKIPTDIPGPKIIYAHLMVPHPPFVFDQNAGFHIPRRPYTLAEGTELQGGREAYWSGYRGQVKFINREIMKVVDEILARSETSPIILIMGDHGPASMFSWNIEEPGCLWERTSNLYAILLPGHQSDGTVYPSMTPVNTFRVIFNTYFGTSLPLLEDSSYLMSWQQPTLKVDVTDQRDSREGCTVQEK
jgi:hypothetical protein